MARHDVEGGFDRLGADQAVSFSRAKMGGIKEGGSPLTKFSETALEK